MDQIKLYYILRMDLKLFDDKAADFVSAMGTVAERAFDSGIQTAVREFDARIQTLATKDDLRELSLATRNDICDLYKTIYLSGLVQFIVIVGSVLAIVKFMR